MGSIGAAGRLISITGGKKGPYFSNKAPFSIQPYFPGCQFLYNFLPLAKYLNTATNTAVKEAMRLRWQTMF
jgi:hypothetical protein